MKHLQKTFRLFGAGWWSRTVSVAMLISSLGLAALNGRAAGAAPMTFESSSRQISLLELYTSEGCSSCPPAETWLSGLKDNPGLWRDFVPVAFHVDYWNYLGWRDPWSREEYSDRQQEYARIWHAANVYTPEFVLNGQEWQRSFWSKAVPQTGAKDAGVLRVSSPDGQEWQATYTVPADSTAGVHIYQLHTAELVCEVGSDVKAGENSGRRLNHDFAALTLTEQPLVSKTNELRGTFRIDGKSKPATGRLALAVWVVPNGQTVPIQAVGGWLP